MKKMILICFVLMIMISASRLTGKVVQLPDLMNPESIAVDMDKAFIVERESVSIFSLKDFKLLRKFGKRGGGPGEFKTVPGYNLGLYIQPGQLVINSLLKVSIFLKEGKFLKEIKKIRPSLEYQPLDSYFVAFSTKWEDGVHYNIFSLYNTHDGNFDHQKEFYKTKNAHQSMDMIPKEFNPLNHSSVKYYCRYSKIFISELNGSIHVFGKDGKERSVIKYDYGELKVSEKLKEEVFGFYRINPTTRPFFEQIKKAMRFPETFPPVRDFRIADSKVYVLPFARENGKHWFYIFNLKGKFVKKIETPIQERNIMELFPYAIENGKLYQLVENEDDEAWELHITALERGNK